MTATTGPEGTRWPGGRRLRDGHELYWWVELIVIVVVYLVYSEIRNSSTAGAQRAYENALRIIDWQGVVHLNIEQAWQDAVIGFEPLLIVANYFYGSAYIIVSILALVFLFRLHPEDYPLWRNTLAFGTVLALIGFAFFPLMPPRLLPTMDPSAFHYVDTLAELPTFWSFNDEAMAKISNQYAAMPSLHCGWALWVCAVFYPRVRTWWAKALSVAYVVATVVTVIITANHYVLDAVGGFAVFGVGYGLARLVTRAGRSEPEPEAATAGGSAEQRA